MNSCLRSEAARGVLGHGVVTTPLTNAKADDFEQLFFGKLVALSQATVEEGIGIESSKFSHEHLHGVENVVKSGGLGSSRVSNLEFGQEAAELFQLGTIQRISYFKSQ